MILHPPLHGSEVLGHRYCFDIFSRESSALTLIVEVRHELVELIPNIAAARSRLDPSSSGKPVSYAQDKSGWIVLMVINVNAGYIGNGLHVRIFL